MVARRGVSGAVDGGMRARRVCARWLPAAWGAAVALALLGPLLHRPAGVRADDTSEATALFASGNRHFQTGSRASGARRTRELEAAVADYTASLRLIRSRNVLFNNGLALDMLGRPEAAFDHFSEYLRVPGLSADEQAEGQRRLDALRARVAVLSITSEPAGAEVWVDRRDLAPRGRTPCDLAVAAGSHPLWLRAEGHTETEARVESTLGSTTRVALVLRAHPVSLQVLGPQDLPLTLDGAAITAGARLEVAPGAHVLRIGGEGEAGVERRFDVMAGSAPMVLDMGAAAAGLTSEAATRLQVRLPEPGRVLIDNVVVAVGRGAEIPVVEGEHDVRVEATGRAPLELHRAFARGESVGLDVEFRSDGGSLDESRMGFGLSTIAALLAGVGLGAAAVDSMGAWENCPGLASDCKEPRDRVQMLNGLTDTTFALAAALGTVTIALYIADDGPREPSAGTFTVGLAPVASGGGALVASGRFGGAL